jgi:hypothetical protein
MYNLSSNPVNIGNHGSGNYGTYYWFNNTVDCSVGGCGGAPPSGPFWTIYDNNNQTIPNPLDFSCAGCTVRACSVGSGNGCTDLAQSSSAATTQGYTSSEGAAYAPISTCTSATCGTVQSGTNVQSYCTALSSINAAAATACQASTTTACTYNTSNRTLSCPRSARVPRPSITAWDIGAYQFSAAGGADTSPAPPTSLAATVH